VLECLWTPRRAEVAALAWRDLDVARGLVYVRKGKGNKPTWTLLPRSSQVALAAWFAAASSPPDAAAPMFPRPCGNAHARKGGHHSPGGLGKLVQRLLTRAGLWTHGIGGAHRFRRSFATTYLKANPSDLAGLQKLMRHTLLSTTGKYCFFEPEDLAPRMAAMEL
jgi:integrase